MGIVCLYEFAVALRISFLGVGGSNLKKGVKLHVNKFVNKFLQFVSTTEHHWSFTDIQEGTYCMICFVFASRSGRRMSSD